MAQIINFEGQRLVYSQDLKLAKITIDEPFFKAGKIFGWGDKSPGLGLNLHIVEFVLKTKCVLVIHVASVGKDYWLSYDKFFDFLKNNNTDYMIRKTVLKIIPWKLCTRHNPVVVN